MLIVMAVFTCLVSAGSPAVRAETGAPGEYDIKAAFLFNFAKFTEWPAESFPDAVTPVTICVLGDDPFGGSLEIIGDKMIDRRKTRVQKIRGTDEISGCHVLFISESERRHLGPVLEAARQQHALTISDMEQFDRAGGMIRLFTANNRIRFSINAGAARRAGVTLSSKLMRLAVSVIE